MSGSNSREARSITRPQSRSKLHSDSQISPVNPNNSCNEGIRSSNQNPYLTGCREFSSEIRGAESAFGARESTVNEPSFQRSFGWRHRKSRKAKVPDAIRRQDQAVSRKIREDRGKEETEPREAESPEVRDGRTKRRRSRRRRMRRGRREGGGVEMENCSRMVASHPSTSADPAERQNARRRHPLNNEALGFYACLTSPRERSFSLPRRGETYEFVATDSASSRVPKGAEDREEGGRPVESVA